MVRSRLQMLQPVYDLVCEAGGHFRDGRQLVPANFDRTVFPDWVGKLVDALVAAHQSSLGSKFCTTYRANEPVDMQDLLGWIQIQMLPIDLLLYGDAGANVGSVVPSTLDAEIPSWVAGVVGQFEGAREAYQSAQRLAVIIAARLPIVPTTPPGAGISTTCT